MTWERFPAELLYTARSRKRPLSSCFGRCWIIYNLDYLLKTTQILLACWWKKKNDAQYFASLPYTVPRRLRHSSRIWNGPYPQGPPPTLYTHFQTHPTVGYAPTLVNSWFQPQPAYPNNNYSPNGSYTQPTTSLGVFLNYSHFMPPQPSVRYPSSNIYSHSIQPQPMHSKSTTSIECPFLKLPKETIKFSKMLDDPEGFFEQ
ncbi:hypothetical protein CEXT_193191 [Caerostris extrusa]|uniref:Uncharacterized protein n=1 Tax=Caerostris extrusa TaxID=172846 RepID=A0AAV4UWR6_CAEEX|nr:hypothetical protein CEXT_193191 [Caerostris extrusa]